jgi:hypothetical protein
MPDDTAPATPSTWDLLWNIRLSALYHLKRERFLDGVDKLSKAVSALGGAAAFAQFKTPQSVWGPTIAAVITIVATISLVYGPSAKARKHAELARDFRRLEAQILALGGDVSAAQLAKFESENASLSAQEPASLGALVTQCHNEMCEAFNMRDQITPLPWRHMFFKNLFDIDQTMAVTAKPK